MGPTGQKQGLEGVREMEAKGHLCGEADRARPLFLEAQVARNFRGIWRIIAAEDKGKSGLTEVWHSLLGSTH